MTTGEIITIVVGAVGIVLTVVVSLWIYFEQQREKDRNERRAARHSEITGHISHLREVLGNHLTALESKFDTRMESLSRRMDEQATTLRAYGTKIDHFDKTVHQMDKRLVVLEAAKRIDEDHEKRRAAEKASS